MTAKPLTLFCREVTCGNSLLISPDDRAPEDWICPVCEDRIEEQQRSEWIETEMKRVRELEREAAHASLPPTRSHSTRTRTGAA